MSDNHKKKLFEWTPEKTLWYAAACEYSGNDRNKKISEAILDVLPPHPNVCDIGCGIGAISMELAPKASKVTAIDIDADALKFLRKASLRRGINNIDLVHGDFNELSPPLIKTDCMVFCMIRVENLLEKAKLWTDRKIVIVTNPADYHSFSPKTKKNENARIESLNEYLKNSDFSFTKHMVSTSSGQPLRDFKDAISFSSSYASDKSLDEIVKMLNENLEETGRTDFPLYLPNNKNYLIFTVEL
ncbi:MAG: methyltransferase domain-containing protein [Oscillospiraceae bacterium]|nr:methyltransferase domain-containing protein [Oscillospiraceae bacterium]